MMVAVLFAVAFAVFELAIWVAAVYGYLDVLISGTTQVAPGTGQCVELKGQVVLFGGIRPHGLNLHQQVSAPYEKSDDYYPSGSVELFHWQRLMFQPAYRSETRHMRLGN